MTIIYFDIEDNQSSPNDGVRTLSIRGPNISLDSIGKLFSDVDEISIGGSAPLSMVDFSSKQTPLINVRRLIVNDANPGLEHLLDGVMLPRLECLNGYTSSLAVILARRKNQLKTLDTIEHLVITDQIDKNAKCASAQQWQTVLDVFPRLKTLLVTMRSTRFPPIQVAEFFVYHIKRTIRLPLILEGAIR